jgi:uncharacterized protein (DUF983 family)
MNDKEIDPTMTCSECGEEMKRYKKEGDKHFVYIFVCHACRIHHLSADYKKES